MEPSENKKQLDEILKRAEEREAKIRRRTILYTLIPVLVGLIFLAYSSYKIYTGTKEVERLDSLTTQYKSKLAQLIYVEKHHQQIVDSLKIVIDTLKINLDSAQKKLEASTDMGQYIHPVDMTDVKSVSSSYPEAGRILERILNLRNNGVTWKLGGTNPNTGFDSPSFAIYILKELNLIDDISRGNEKLVTASQRLMNRLTRTNNAEVGDLYFYPSGYVLF